ncbi:MAG: hypothetical protein AB1540_05085 [Bdellovibrionota bacterium]
MFKFKGTQTLGAIFIVGAIFLSTSGCAPNLATQNPADRKATLASLGLHSAALNEDDANWRCPHSDNVTLRDSISLGGFDFTANGSFKVCVGRNDDAKFRVRGTTSSGSLCVYPLQVCYSRQSSNCVATNGGALVRLLETPQCAVVSRAPLEFQFNSRNANYMVIVDINFTNDMNRCLSGSSACPPHSEGFVQ